MVRLNYFIFIFILITIVYVVKGNADVTCKGGETYAYGDIRSSGTCGTNNKITTEEECKAAQEYNSKNNVDNNKGFGRRMSWTNYPPGCIMMEGSKYYWNDYHQSSRHCSNGPKCICKTKTCIKCPIKMVLIQNVYHVKRH